MKRVARLIAIFLLIATAAGAFEWNSVAARVERSLVALKTLEGQIYCTGFVINNEENYVLTAAHCVDHTLGLVVDKKFAWVVWQDKEADLAVIEAPAVNRPELKPGQSPVRGEGIASLGFGYGFSEGMFATGQVSSVGQVVDGLPGKWVVINFALIPGMSGGPTVDMDGKVVMINQRGNDVIGLGRSIDDIYKMTEEFWRD